MNIKAFTILFFTLLAFILFVNIVNAEVVKDGLVYWSNETIRFFAGSSKIHIDNNTYVIDYDLNKGWIKVHAEIPTLLAFCDPFSGKWIKIFVKRGDTNVTLPFKPQSYGGLKMVIISSPWGFGFVKKKEDVLSWWDYAIVILRSEMAKWSWERTFYAISLFVVGLALSRHMKKDRLIINKGKHILVVFIVVLLIFAVLSMRYTTDTVKIVSQNTTIVKNVPHLLFDTYYVKEWYNYLFALCFIFGYIFGMLIWNYDFLHVAYVTYNQPIRLHVYPYDRDRGIIRDFDGKLTLIDFKNEFKQFINFELNGQDVTGILAIGEENYSYPEFERAKLNIIYALAGFFGFLALSIIASYLNVFRLDLFYCFLFAGIIAVLTNWQVVKQYFGFDVEKVKVLRCSELMNEDNYTKMLKEAEIKHVIEEYEKLLRDYVKEKITQPRRTVKHLLSMIRQVKVTKTDVKPKGGGRSDEDKD